ncbi:MULTISPECIES: hypothetical protein [unclassified Rhizobium]|uniref:hypothetical protein n=1 Tax=unclassified Rhizobium TaxID=2613769 RepID=UPI00161D504B|nr:MULTISPECIES: hypothetical protein [unclassified Rhizobium]MBB3319699.1 expansin (peptidoglycan-binding protein) [Rhizobium sp. BK181]MBB3544825.1 expansin (peptidoglycan-binding protein) [Rhizobium sp. BK399]MCS3743464.1 expansin (peptidoglycan-binding protein) [Rhizobium sp. BK661]MCS4095506.1 expansin (peptidoglycan-binding protein) [Rhizobium sp. BK176]
MTKAVVFGVEGDDTLYIADLEAGTVKALDSAPGDLGKIAAMRKGGVKVVKKVDFAVAVSSAKAAFSGHVEP